MLLLDRDSASLTLNELARRASMAKSNVYRYFESREAVLLALLWEEWTLWFRELSEEGARQSPLALDELVGEITSLLVKKPLLCHLTSILPSVLERNLSEEAILEFKLGTLQFFGELADYFVSRCPVLTKEKYVTLIHDTVTIVAGLYPFSHPSETVAKALQTPELAPLRHDFARELERLVGMVARGLAASDESGAP